jgi:hypothetical protein
MPIDVMDGSSRIFFAFNYLLKGLALQARRDLNRSLPFITQTKLIRRGLLESYAQHNLASYASSSLSSKIAEERNAVAHGGDVFSNIEVINDQEESSETAEQWKWNDSPLRRQAN